MKQVQTVKIPKQRKVILKVGVSFLIFCFRNLPTYYRLFENNQTPQIDFSSQKEQIKLKLKLKIWALKFLLIGFWL
jgi:hypothetical protein